MIRRQLTNNVRVQVRLFNVRTQQPVFSKEYTGTDGNPRLYAHTIADEIHQQQRNLRGVARTRLAFSSDRNRERVVGPVDNREVKEIYIANAAETINITPTALQQMLERETRAWAAVVAATGVKAN